MWKVMVADDEPYIREGIEQLIPWKVLGCEFAGSARNGKELLEQIHGKRPDIVIVDIRMPVMNGLEVAKYIEEKELGIEVIFLTAYTDFQYACDAIKYGVRAYVLKTAALDDLPDALEKVTRRLQKKVYVSYRMAVFRTGNKGIAFDKLAATVFGDIPHRLFRSEDGDYGLLLTLSEESVKGTNDTCRKLLELCRNFMGGAPRACLSPIYHDAGKSAGVYDETMEYLLSRGEDGGLIVLDMMEDEEPDREEELSGMDATPDLLIQVQSYVRQNYCTKFNLNDIAEAVHVNKSYLSRYYKQRTGENLFDDINRMRIEKAQEYIRGQNRKIYEIAGLVGFEETAYFSRVFKRICGMSPTEYDRQCRDNPV